MNIKELEKDTGTLSNPSKMPSHGHSTPAADCITGSKLAKIAGSVCSKCYARKGRYVFPNVQDAQRKRRDLLSSPRWVESMTELIKRKEKSGVFRWKDSGDIGSTEELSNIVQVARNLPDITFWLPTREYGIVSKWVETNGRLPQNLIVRLSAYMIDGKPPTTLAKRLGVLTSTVSSDKQAADCPAYKQGGACGDCRRCWDASVENVCYPQH